MVSTCIVSLNLLLFNDRLNPQSASLQEWYATWLSTSKLVIECHTVALTSA